MRKFCLKGSHRRMLSLLRHSYLKDDIRLRVMHLVFAKQCAIRSSVLKGDMCNYGAGAVSCTKTSDDAKCGWM